MSRPVSITVSHSLGRDAARERLRRGVETIRSRLQDLRMELVEERWDGDSLNFGVSALGYTVRGKLDVEETLVRIEVMLPWLLASFAERLRSKIEHQGQILLDHKKPLT